MQHNKTLSSLLPSPYASAVVMVRKRDGKLRLCVDYRLINKKSHHDAYPLRRIDEALDALNGTSSSVASIFCSGRRSREDSIQGWHGRPL